MMETKDFQKFEVDGAIEWFINEERELSDEIHQEGPEERYREYNQKLEWIKKFEWWETLDLTPYEALKKYDQELFVTIIDFHTELLNYVIADNKWKEEITLRDIKSQKDSFISGDDAYMYNSSINKLLKAYEKSNQEKIDIYKLEVVGFHNAIRKSINNKRTFNSWMR